jgi:hypothetical protein
MAAFKSVSNAQKLQPLSDRYPGTLPFSDTPLDHRRFFGRDEEARLLQHQLLRADLLVLFAKPGLGKTSLLNAKLFPLLRQRDFLPLSVRFNHTDPSLSPLQVLTDAIEQTCKAEKIDYTPGDKDSLWEFFKTAIFWRGDRFQTPVLILDQFEEIFTLQVEGFRHAAAAELGQLLGRRLPERVRKRFQEGQSLPFSEKPPEVKVLLSVREDDLGMLQELTPEIPSILQNRFRLTGLSMEDARRAITGPARLAIEGFRFSTKPFEYNKTTVEDMIAAARNKEGSIDPFFLQILCHQIEKQVRQRQSASNPTAANLIVDSSYLGGEQGIKALTANLYLDALNQITRPKLRRRARRLCEEGLLTAAGRRHGGLPIENIKKDYKLDDISLEVLETARLLRKVPNYGSFSYEISHDRLAEAIREKRRWRLPRGVQIGLAILVAVLLVSTALISYFQIQGKRHAEAERENTEPILDYMIGPLWRKLLSLSEYRLLEDIRGQIDEYYKRMGNVGESDKVLGRKGRFYSYKGDLLLQRGEPEPALKAYNDGLKLFTKLAEDDQANTDWKEALSFNYERIGNLQKVQGNFPAALDSYSQSLDIRKKLTERDPTNAQWQQDLSLSHVRIGDVLRAQGNFPAALESYQQSLALAKKLTEREPANAPWQHDLWVSQGQIGDVLRAQAIS